VRVQEAEVARLEDLLERHTIRAPFQGYVVAEHTEVGEWLDKGEPVAEIFALDVVDVTIPVLEDYVSHLTVGMPVVVSVGAVSEEKLLGKVALVVPTADVRARTFPVKVRLQNRPSGGTLLLKAGMFARATIAVGKKTLALLVPKDAIVLGGRKPVIYVLDGTFARPVPVDLGVAEDSLIQVFGDVKAGQRVVVRGNERLHKQGQQVRVASD
jgi:RND family efflux transporter MFP subunit